MKPIVIFGNFSLSMVVVAALCGCHQRPPTPEPPVKVKAVKVAAGGGSGSFYYSGTIEASQNIGLSFLGMGTVETVSVREGDRIEKGRLLAKLDCQSSENSLRIAQAKAQQAEDAFRRFEPMYKNGNLPEIKMVEIRTGRTQAELAVKLAEKSVADCSIIAPEAGIVSQRDVEPGDNAVPGKTVIRMVSVDKVYATVSVPEQEISYIHRGAGAVVELSANKRHLRGKIADVGVTANPLARTYTARVLIDNASNAVLPGMLCNVYLSGAGSAAAGHSGIVIPAAALRLDANGNQIVYVVDPDRRVHARVVASSGFRKGGVLIGSGLTAGETIVVEGVQKLDENMRVEL
ncbi:MAG: efflux RND transporter periplasmic adaptor subunit [Elusimicrobiaceae bacterium]|nr:efflux RND transporter periplasmic adaptor subunit [Elusimicrobiaceae bacterium]